MTIRPDVSSAREELQSALVELGFSAYEAKCYVGLLGTKGLTGYGVSKATSVPQPKVYETLRRLVRRGAARQISDEPAVFVGTTPAQLLALLEREFQGRHALAAQAAVGVDHEDVGSDLVVGTSLSTREAVLSAAHALIDGASRVMWISAGPSELDEFADDLRRASDRGVEVNVVPGSSSRALKLALVVDSQDVLTASADADAWDGVRSNNKSIVVAIDGLLRRFEESQENVKA